VFSAALAAIPSELHEAARVDGASDGQVFFRVTLPLLAPTVATVSILTVISSIALFDIAFAVGGPTGSPGGSVDVLGLLFYRVAFSGGTNASGTSGALATMMLLAILAVIVPVMLLRRRVERILE
jgi:raffinose/stachyose/melibiose transport system permease protein